MRTVLVWMVLGTGVAWAVDSDGDGLDDAVDTCPNTVDVTNTDTDADGWGDACVAPGATVATSAWLGTDAFVQTGATVEAYAQVGDHALVRAGAFVGARALIGSGQDALSGVDLGENALVGRRAVLSAGVVVGDGAVLGRGVWVGPHADMGSSALVGYAARIGAHAAVGDNSAVGSLAYIGPGAHALAAAIARGAVVRGDVALGAVVGPDAVVEGGASVGVNARLRKGARVASEAEVGDGARIGRDAVVERLATAQDGVRIGAGATIGTGASVAGAVSRGAVVDAVAASGRGLWHWRHSGQSAGTEAVVGDASNEALALAEFSALDIEYHYGSYVNRPVSEPAVIASWVASLHAQGAHATVLLGDPLWIDPAEHAFMLSLIDQRLLNYNASRSNPNERFDGIHLDIEPQADPTWSAATAEDKRLRVLALRDALQVVRDHLDANGGAGLSIEADLPVWFDNLPPTLGGTGSVGWHTEDERDAWFANLPVDVISMMAYERSSLGSILSGVATEDTLFRGELRVGIDDDGVTFPDHATFFTMADDLEAAGYPVELHSYTDFATIP